MSEESEFYDKKADEWEDGVSEERLEINRYFLTDVLKKNMTILDIGCGKGDLCVHYAGQGYRIFGVDFSSKMIAHAVNRKLADLDCTFVIADITKGIIFRSKFSLVMLLDTLEHVTDVERALTNSISLVDEKGHLYVTIPHPEYRKNRGMEAQPIDHAIDIDWLKEFMISRGMTIVKEKGYGHDFGAYTTYYGVLAKKGGEL